MDKPLLKKAAIQSVILMTVVIAASFALRQYQAVAISASNLSQDVKDSLTLMRLGSQDANRVGGLADSANGLAGSAGQPDDATGGAYAARSLEELKSQVSEDIFPALGDHYLAIKKPAGLVGKNKLALEDLYITKSIRLTLSGLSNADIAEDMFLRVKGQEFFSGIPSYTETVTREADEEDNSVKEVITRDYGADPCHNITVTSQQDSATGLYSVQIVLELDSVYAYVIYEDKEYYFIALKKPSDLYDKILVIDPGHGGKDAGAVSRDKNYYEKDINLAIAMELKKLLDREDIKVYYTRTGDDKVFLRPRVTLANAVDCDYFISIHCNSSTVASPNGLEVLYYDRAPEGVSNFALATIFSDELGKVMPLCNRGEVQMFDDDIFIMDNSRVPTVLIEAGYLSNSDDLRYLSNPENQAVIAQGIYSGIMRAFRELPVQKE